MTDRLTIALDYDRTYDADPSLWNLFILLAESAGHRVILATYRDERHDKTDLLRGLEQMIPVYYTRGVAKRWWLENFSDEKVNIWVDDRPEAILNNSHLGKEGLAQWREDNKANGR